MPLIKLPPAGSAALAVPLAILLAMSLAVPGAGAATTPLPPGCEPAGTATAVMQSAPATPAFPPIPLQVRTPAEPAAFASVGWRYLVYELHLQNFSAETLNLRGLQVLDADRLNPVAQFNEEQLAAQVRGQRQLAAGQAAIAFLCLAFPESTPVPAQLRHRILLAEGGMADGPAIGTRATQVRVLGQPLLGSGWSPDNNPSLHSHHRTGIWVADGIARLSRRYALDWKKYNPQGKSWSGDQRDVKAYHAYGEKVMAVADGVVIAAQNHYPDNIPRTAAGFTPAIPLTLESVAGNRVVLDIGGGQFAYYAHLQPGSVRVKPGDRVKRGQWLAQIGNSGDAREPHLHFQVTDGPDILASEGLPHVFERYAMQREGGQPEVRTQEYPMGKIVLDFGPEAAPVN